MITIGSGLLSLYNPSLPKSRWLYNQCPTYNWIPMTGTNYYTWYRGISSDTGSASKTTVQNVWNWSSCTSASPIKQWWWTGSIIIASHIFLFIVWLINIIRFNSIGYVWFWASRLAIGVPSLQLLFTILAVTSYGTRDEVSNSWFGTTLTVSSSGVATIP